MSKRVFKSDNYIIKNKIEPKGAIGNTAKCVEKSTNVLFALKTLKYKPISVDQTKKVLTALGNLECPLISKVVSFKKNHSTYQILYQYIGGIALSTYLNKSSGHKLSPTERLKVLYGTALATKKLHDAKMMHLDIKPANIIIRKNDKVPILTHSTLLSIFKIDPNSLRISPQEQDFMAPDVFESEYAPSVDIFSLGCLMAILITNKSRKSGALSNIENEEVKAFVNRCLNERAKLRPNINEFIDFILNKKNELLKDSEIDVASFDEFVSYIQNIQFIPYQEDQTQEEEEEEEEEEEIVVEEVEHKRNNSNQPASAHENSNNQKVQNNQLQSSSKKLDDDNSEDSDSDTPYQKRGGLQKVCSKFVQNLQNKFVNSQLSLVAQERALDNIFLEARRKEPIRQDEALMLYKNAADKGHTWSMTAYAMKCSKPEESKHYYAKAADNGNGDALNNLGCMKEMEEGIEEAGEFYRKSAETNNPCGQNNYGRYLEAVENDLEAAFQQYKASAIQNNKDGMANMARIIEFSISYVNETLLLFKENKCFSTTGNPELDQKNRNCIQRIYKEYSLDKACQLYLQSFNDMAKVNLGLLNIRSKQTKEGIAYLLQATYSNMNEATFNLAYVNASDETEYKKLCDKDFSPAINNYALINITSNPQKSAEMLKKAADLGNSFALNNYGVTLEEGVGCEKNVKGAFNKYLEAAEKGVPEAMYNLGRCYEKGIGVIDDKETAIKYYKKAVEMSKNKNLQAVRALRLLEEKL
ncbi:hypothetical protein TRFO_08978 [Tritrichomonas foetus]|uniref:Protein kinase domain-containing protein n=1 Tax=Tritrichomonas foetus TaxID=1144522 RepID=A0A1J4JLD5_9EUKA|nr:hypothetical protein TRFO_08978 [Tritrichomonas foetus]|eukprot:OHS98379.1 hypothetical protein TRFO_08978 [Tritrichomonas foetus]